MKQFSTKEKTAYGLGAVGKDMVYALSSGYVMYYYQDILGLSATFVGLILMIARVFDALNDPFMGILVAKIWNHPQCICSLCFIFSTISFINRTDALFCHCLYSLGCYLYHDGYSVLVHDSCCHRKTS